MSDKTAIFTNDNTESPLQVIRQTMSVALSDEGSARVSFATNRGKGSGAQVISVDDYAEVVSTLQGYADAGIEEREEEALSPAETIRRTIRVEDGLVSFRTRSGKGAKPAKIPLAQFSEVCELLTGTVSAVEAAGQSLAPASDAGDEPADEPAMDGDHSDYEDMEDDE
ncbi:hypothetical protein CMI47_01495 [Candidatus Pacearchaeota archaeon]|jgi:hypothetical protein|nr:hypothetical protein [Candidatus Pacearchaeota archaeon]